MSHIYIHIFFLQSVEAYWWRVCYQRGLPLLVFGDYACEYSRNLYVSKQKQRQKYLTLERLIGRSSHHLDMERFDRLICLSYFRRADLPSPLLSLY